MKGYRCTRTGLCLNAGIHGDAGLYGVCPVSDGRSDRRVGSVLGGHRCAGALRPAFPVRSCGTHLCHVCLSSTMRPPALIVSALGMPER